MISKYAESIGVKLTEQMTSQFETYLELLLEYNEKFNLTTITDRNEIIIKHFIDSLTCSRFLPSKASVVDVGSGAGFPGIPLAIVHPDARFALIDARRKRVEFLEVVAARLGLSNVKCHHIRAEDAGRELAFRGQYDVAVSRAITAMKALTEYCLPLVRVNGVMLAMKGREPEVEVADATSLAEILGGSDAQIHKISLPGEKIVHSIVTIEKKHQTPTKYPRKGKKLGTE